MLEDLDVALADLRSQLLDADRLVRAVAAGRRRGTVPRYQRAVLRPVDLKAGRHLQVVVTERSPLTRNVTGPDVATMVDDLLAEPFGNWVVETVDQVTQVRVTKKGRAQVHVGRTSRREVQTGHDRVKERLLDPDDPLFDALGSGADKRRQVDAFLRQLAPTVARAADRAATRSGPVRVVDLGCGNAYLTFAAHRYLSQRLGRVEVLGVDLSAEMVARNRALAERLGATGLEFRHAAIGDDAFDPTPVDIVLALHACDTATDDALARAVRWGAPVVLAAPCCHHDVQRQLQQRQAAGDPAPHPYAALTRHPILRERFADVLTDALRAGVLRDRGYRVEVVEFVDSRHTPRNALIRAELTRQRDPGTDGVPAAQQEYLDLATVWGIRPRLADLLDARPDRSS